MTAALWLTTKAPYRGRFTKPRDWNDDGSPVSKFETDEGNPRLDRVPAIGYDGTDIRRMYPIKEKRYIDLLRHDGHVIHYPMTTSAAAIVEEDTSYQQDRLRKAQHFGWFEWPNDCPVLQAAIGPTRGGLRPQQLKAPCNRRQAETKEEKAAEAAAFRNWRGAATPPGEAWWGRQCSAGSFGGAHGPCIHAIAERAERQRLNKAKHEKREKDFKSEAVLAQEAQTAALTKLAERIGDTVAVQAEAKK